MSYVVEYEVAALLFVSIIYIYAHIKYPIKSKKNLLFRIMCIILLLTEALDIFSAYIIFYKDVFPSIVNLIVNTAYYMLGSFLCFILSCYVDLWLVPINGKKILVKTRNIILIIIEFLILLNLFSKHLFYIDGNNVYTHGPYFYVMHIVSIFYIVIAGMTLTINWKKLDEKNKFCGVTIIASYVIPMILQIFFFPNILLCMFGASLMLLVIFFSLETPDYIKLQETLELLEKTQNELIESNKRNYKLAHFDQMSGLYNRTAYEEKLEELSNHFEEIKKDNNIIIFTADLNFLKYLNDNFGHHMGDNAIRETAQILLECFSSNNEFCYRTGGDEFCVISIGNTIEDYEIQFNNFLKRTKEKKNEVDYPYSIACAYHVITEDSLAKAMQVVDEKMYKNKTEIKEKFSKYSRK